jgi:hypothetical protein
MQVLTDHALLAYLHDAECRNLVWDCSLPEGRAVTLDLEVNPEAQSPEWDGRQILLSFKNVMLCRLTGWGHVTGGETLDSIDERVSAEFMGECRRHEATGLFVPPLKLGVSFISGSSLEMACDRIEYEMSAA